MKVTTAGFRPVRRGRVRALALTVLMGIACAVSAQDQPDYKDYLGTRDISTLGLEERASLDAKLTLLLNADLNRYRYFPDQIGPIEVTAKVDLTRGLVVVDLGEVYGPKALELEMERVQSDLENAIFDWIQQTPGVGGVDFLYGGKELYHWFPEERGPEPVSSSGAFETALVSAAHGFYFDHGSGAWRQQGNAHSGAIEDDITQDFASELDALLRSESLVFVHLARSLKPGGEGNVHAASGKPWWKIAARYWLQLEHPDAPEVWNSLPGSTAPDRERREDARSRPLVANHIGAVVAFHLHADTHADTSTRGIRVYHQVGRDADEMLGDCVLRHMQKQIAASSATYRSYPVARHSMAVNRTENRLANMPSVTISVGSLSNADDVAAAHDPLFQAAAMSGVEQGFRAFREGGQCADAPRP
ncbi:N-acetylmuramoyl-L-alanine amidase [Luteibacter sp. Sphag1AF]|uniref:N-acetylmuramoyl-L-alanine amidase n=1 Tax=Luteibacter sp. Sphag1AF TaxID=2587031 RepID=UPI0016212FA9|nr:N-acetylmuramoyl-L-alanine amidase [Luteibacter sp. Sphag1AF]MBB3226194.1 N-acetylmuramoyl-L-alanine amidase [Luteibacter sp. Sphag1AF]